MTRKSNIKKYEQILERLAKGETQSSIVITEKCSYGTISAAKQWDKNGRPITITTTGSKSTNKTKIVISIPNFWLGRLNEEIEVGSWIDYTDAIVDIIRTYFRTQMEPHTHTQIETPRGGRGPVRLRGKIMRELKKSFAPERFREFYKTYFGDDDSIPKERAKHQKNLTSELMKEIDLIKSSFKGQESENYIYINYHGQPLIKEECDVLLELEKETGIIPKWDFIFGEIFEKGIVKYKNLKPNEKPWTFSYSILGNHIVALMIINKGLTILPKSIKQLKYLHFLDLRRNQLTDLPESIGQLEHLEELILQDNVLKSLPESIRKLINLRVLNLENNNLTALPDTICNLPCYIELSDNKISSLDKKVLETCKMDLTGNPIMDTRERNLQETNLWKIRKIERKNKYKK